MKTLLNDLVRSLLFLIVFGILCCAIYPLAVWAIGQSVFHHQANGSLVTDQDGNIVGSALIGQAAAAPQYFHPRPSAAGNGYDASNSSGSNLGPISDKLLNGATATQPAPAPTTQGADSQPATIPATLAAGSPPAATSVAPSVESLAFDGVRLRVIHYAVDNAIPFKLYNVKYDSAGKVVTKIEVPLATYQDKDGNLNDIALVNAFPHVGDPPDRLALIAGGFATPIPADAVTASGSGLDPQISPSNAVLQKARVAKARNMTEDAVQKLIDQYTDRPSLGILGDPGVNVLLLNMALDKVAPVAASSPTAPSASVTAPATTRDISPVAR